MLVKKNIKSRTKIIAIICMVILPGVVFSLSNDLIKFDRAKENFKKGIHFFNRYQYLAAAEYFRKAVGVYPDYNTAREYLARSYKFSGFTDEALKEWEILSNQNPNNVYIKNKIDAIRFRQVQSESQTGFDINRFVLSGEYVSSNYKKNRFPNPTGIAIDKEKNLYLTSFSSGKIIKIDINGSVEKSINPKINSKIFGIDYFNGKLAASDFKHDSIYILDTDLKILKTFGQSGKEDGEFHGPEGLCFDDKGYIYVVDSGNQRVQKFDEDGKFILKFGEPGEYEGQLKNPTDVAVNKENVYVTDTGNRRLSCFDDSGNFIKNISLSRMEKPRGISNHNNSLLVSDESNGLLFYNINNELTNWFKSWDDDKRSFSKLFSAKFDRDGFLYCLDYNYESAFVFSPLRIRYTNLDVELASIDVKKYPVVALYLNIKDRSGKPVYGLNPDNFKIVEDSARVSGIYTDYLKDINPSASMVLCIDRSESNSGYHNEMPWVSEFILKKMRKNDALKVINFNSDIWVGNNYDWSRRRALRAIKKREYGSGKNIGLALYNSINDLLQRTDRRALILVTDGIIADDSFQKYTPQYIIEYAKSHYIPIHIITFKDKNPVLNKIAVETGGSFMKAGDADSLRRLYDTIKGNEEYRYVLVYRSYKLPVFKGWWSDVKIEVNYKGQTGFEWGGYFVP